MTHIFWDLDGTIWDASAAIAVAWTEVFSTRGMARAITDNDIRSVAGKPYLECLKIIIPQALEWDGFSKLLEDLTVAEQKYLKELGGAYFPRAIETIRFLSKQNQLYLVSNCNGWYLDTFLQLSGLGDFFRDTICFTTRNEDKGKNIKYIMGKYSIQHGYYVGDTMGDKTSAESNGLVFLHAKYGFDASVSTQLSFERFEELVDFFSRIDNRGVIDEV